MPASKLTKLTKITTKSLTPEKAMERVVEQFVNGKLRDEIVSAAKEGKNGVNVEVPVEAYDNLTLFYVICDRYLKPLGYKSIGSHDGGGMYNTLGVSWKKKG